MSLTIVVGTGRCGSTMLSRMLNMHPDILSLSEFWNVFIEHEGSIPTHDVSGAEYWQRIANPARTAYDGLVVAGIITNDVSYPYHGRFTTVDMPSIMHVLVPITDDPDLLYDTLASEVSTWPRRPVAEHCRALFAELATRLGRRVIVERTGGALGYLPLLREQFPEARFVYLYRNGPDSALSMSRYPPYRLAVLNAIADAVGGSPQPELQSLLEALPAEIRSASPEDFKGVIEPPFDKTRFQMFPVPITYFAWLWSNEIRTGTGEIRKVQRDRWSTLRYERLVKNTRDELVRLAEFIGVSAEPRWLDMACAFLDPGRPKAAATRFHPSELAELRAACTAGTRAFSLLESEQAALANRYVGADPGQG